MFGQFKNLATARRQYTVAECDIQATVVGLTLTTLGDGGDQVLLTADRRPSPVDHTQRPAVCTARWSTGR